MSGIVKSEPARFHGRPGPSKTARRSRSERAGCITGRGWRARRGSPTEAGPSPAAGRDRGSGEKSALVLTQGGSTEAAGTESSDEVQALAEAVLEAARVAGLGVTVSFDDGVSPRHIYVND